MNYLGVTYSIGAKPELDPGFIPFGGVSGHVAQRQQLQLRADRHERL